MLNERYGLIIKLIAGLAVLVVILVIFGSKIPGLRDTPLFSRGDGEEQKHLLKPVMDEEGKIEYWTCAMHPSVRLKDSGSCPVCGMDLVPVERRPASTAKNDSKSKKGGMAMNMKGMATNTEEEGSNSRSTFYVSPRRQQLIGVKTQVLKVRAMEKVIRTVGAVEFDETKIRHVHTKVSGWIDKVFVDFQWEYVKKGQPLFSLYSPELVSTQEELVHAVRYQKSFSESEFGEFTKGAESLVESTRRRLRLWDISEDQIKRIERTGKVKKSLVIHSPITGYVTFINAFENMHVTPNTKIYIVADYSSIWIYADIYENEISLVKVGQEAVLTIDSLPGQVFKGRISYILPNIDLVTRTLKARIVFPNDDLKLLSGMYANVEIDIPMGDRLAVVKNAVLRTGKQNLVFVDLGEGNLELRKVELGIKAGDYYEVLRGLKEGERVVSSANFLIDSESKIKAITATWGEGEAVRVPAGKPEKKESETNDRPIHRH